MIFFIQLYDFFFILVCDFFYSAVFSVMLYVDQVRERGQMRGWEETREPQKFTDNVKTLCAVGKRMEMQLKKY